MILNSRSLEQLLNESGCSLAMRVWRAPQLADLAVRTLPHLGNFGIKIGTFCKQLIPFVSQPGFGISSLFQHASEKAALTP